MNRGRFLCVVLTCMAMAGCTTMQLPKPAAPAGGTAATADKSSDAAVQPVRVIEEFGDIPIPPRLKRNDEQSFVYEAPGVVIGVVIYEGFFKGRSIAQFFRNEMPNYGWRFLNAFSDTRYVISFLKENRSCQISVEEGTFGTRVVIKVGPTSN